MMILYSLMQHLDIVMQVYYGKTYIYGIEKLMWATDFPWIFKNPGYDKMSRIIDELLPDLSEYEYNQIGGGNAQKFLRFPACHD